MGREQECPLRPQLPISAAVVRGCDIIVGGDVGIDRLVTDLKDATDRRSRLETEKLAQRPTPSLPRDQALSALLAKRKILE
jgi:hypothetical protein